MFQNYFENFETAQLQSAPYGNPAQYLVVLHHGHCQALLEVLLHAGVHGLPGEQEVPTKKGMVKLVLLMPKCPEVS